MPAALDVLAVRAEVDRLTTGLAVARGEEEAGRRRAGDRRVTPADLPGVR